MALKIGVDTGGTFTDAVLFDDRLGVVAAAKSLTTPHDLAEGIGESLAKLPLADHAPVELVSVSTTLATNAVVEQRGAPVCTLLPGYSQAQVSRSGLLETLRDDPVALLAGGHDATGAERAPLDLREAERIVRRHAAQVSAFAVSSMFGVRNPAHELALRDLVRRVCDKPVTCGHELSAGLNALKRALTAALNARLTPFIRLLMDAVAGRLAALDIDAPLMMVKGDGSLAGVGAVLERPVDTVLSGPAASVVGACFLSARERALVVDMGGTTTDVAVVANGRPATRPDGALVGDWHLMVETLDVHSIGLGGDSEVRFSGGEGIGIGPRRVLPLCLLAERFPRVLERLEAQDGMGSSPSLNRFAVALYNDPAVVSRLDEDELEVWCRLNEEPPLTVAELVRTDRPGARALARLVRKSLAIYSGFTPTDAAHVVGLSDHWNREAAVYAARIWGRQMRHRYGLGRWRDGDAETPSRAVLQRMNALIGETLVRAGVREIEDRERAPPRELVRFLGAVLGRRGDGIFSVSFDDDCPLVAVGAPAGAFFPDAASALSLPLVVPPNAGVAGAVGAVASRVVQRARVTVTQPELGLYRVHDVQGPRDYDALDDALAYADGVARVRARELALRAGAGSPRLAVSIDQNRVDHDIDGSVFFEATVCATAVGAPRVGEPPS